MRDRTDQATAELATLPAYQYKPAPRDNQSKRATLLAYQGPKERPRCETCASCSSWTNSKDNFHCTLGNFSVMRGGICPKYRERGHDSHS